VRPNTVARALGSRLNPDDDRRSGEAAQKKLNVIAEALAALMASRAVEDRNLEEAVTRLRDAVGLEERHGTNIRSTPGRKLSRPSGQGCQRSYPPAPRSARYRVWVGPHALAP
jgi:hypothetical protein